MTTVKKRPKVVSGETIKVATGCGNCYVTVTKDPGGKPMEVFIRLGKSGGCPSATLEAIGRAISIGLRAGVSVEEYIKSLLNIACHAPTFDEGEKILSCVDACARVLRSTLKEEQ